MSVGTGTAPALTFEGDGEQRTLKGALRPSALAEAGLP